MPAKPRILTGVPEEGRLKPARRLRLLAASAAFAIGSGMAAPAHADDAVIEAARKEAKLVIYTGVERAGVQGDLFEFSLLYLTTSLQQRGEILRYDSPQYAKYPPEYSAPGYWTASGLSNIIIMLNTRKVDDANVPQSWWDLAKPYWKGKLTIDNLEVSGTGYNWLVKIGRA